MKSSMRLIWIAATAVAFAPLAQAQNYPTRPVRVIVTFTAGSATDILGRILAQKLTELWGHNVVVDNRGGAGGSIGTAIGAKATPDGYTLIINSSAHTVNPALYTKLPYDTQKDFVDIAPLTGTPNVLVNNVNAKVRTVRDYIADAKARPGQINFASAGIGSGTHLNLEKFKLATQTDVTHIAFKGTPETVTNVMGGRVDVMGGRVDYYFCPLSACLPFVQDGKLRGIAVTSLKRSSLLPNLVTIAESGVPKFEFILWFGMWGPRGLPAPIVAKIRADTARALASPDVRERLIAVANEPMDVKAEDFSAYVRQEIADNARIVAAAGIKPQ
jgi:tripartite-type tricarboxylate transporter receptor subunit TctC